MHSRTMWLPVVLALAACERNAAAPPAAPKVGVAKDVVARVNGVPVTRFEVLLRQRTLGQAGDQKADSTQRALDAIVTEELFAQRAKALGLENEVAFQEEMARVEAQVAEVRRRELTKIFLHQEIIAKASVSDAEARAHFDAHPARFNSEVRVAQLVMKGRAAADAAAAELKRGRTFDELAAERMPDREPGTKPWQLPAMRWELVPSPWWPALDSLEVGQVSAPFLTVSDRWVLLQLLERRPLTDVDFERIKPAIQTQLKADRIEALRQSTEAELRRSARVEMLAAPEAPADAGP